MVQDTILVGQPIYSQVLKLIPIELINQSCKEHQSNYRAKQLLFKDHLTTMLYCVFSKCTSLREVQAGLELCNGKLNHLALSKVPARSTLSDGNKKRKSEVFGTLYKSLYKKYKHLISDSCKLKSSIADKLFVIDSTTITLFKAILKPAGRKCDNGKSKGGIKVHTLLNASNNMPSFIKFSAAATHDQVLYDNINEVPENSIITFDKAYINFEQFEQFTNRGISYVVPQKDNAAYSTIQENELLDNEQEILKDEQIQVSYKQTIEGNEIDRNQIQRRIAYYSKKHNKGFVYCTNNTELTAMEIVQIYQNRWQIELLFKRLKQNFPLTYFLGDNENAIQIQIWCALIGLLLVQVLYYENSSTIAFSLLCTIITLHLLNYSSITAIIDVYKKKRTRVKKQPPNLCKKTNHPLPFQPQLNF